MTTTTELKWNGFVAGDRVVMLIQTMGATSDDEEVVYSAGTEARIDALDDFGPHQGRGVHVTIGYGGREIVNSFDDLDVTELGGVPFRKVPA